MKEDSKDLKTTILDLLNQSPYKKDIDIDNNPFIEVANKIRRIIEHPYFIPFNKVVSNFYAKDILHILWDYYFTLPLNNKITTLKNKGRLDKDIKQDIKVINNFLELLRKNCIYINEIEQNYKNKQNDKFVYDYCINLISDLETKKFDKSQQYQISKIKTTKEEVRNFFRELTKKNALKQYEINNLINLI